MKNLGTVLTVVMMTLALTTLASAFVYEDIVNTLWTASAILTVITLPIYLIMKFIFVIEVDD